MKSPNFEKLVSFYETDTMGVVHHSNYLRYFEDARVAWVRQKGLQVYHQPDGPYSLAVIESQLFYRRPAYFGDQIQVFVQARMEKIKIHCRYEIFSDRFKTEVIASGYTKHVLVDSDLKLVRPPKDFVDVMEKEPWTET